MTLLITQGVAWRILSSTLCQSVISFPLGISDWRGLESMYIDSLNTEGLQQCFSEDENAISHDGEFEVLCISHIDY